MNRWIWFFTVPPYNVQRECGCSEPDYDTLTTEDMAETDMLCRQLMKSGSHGHIFCSKAQFSECIQVEQGAVNRHERVRGRDFVAEWMSLVHVLDKSSYSQDPSRVSLYHLSLTEHAMHIWLVCRTAEGQQSYLFYCTGPPCTYFSRWNTNVLTGISQALFCGDRFGHGWSSRTISKESDALHRAKADLDYGFRLLQIYQRQQNDVWYIYGHKCYCKSLSAGAKASKTYWFWCGLRMRFKNDAIFLACLWQTSLQSGNWHYGDWRRVESSNAISDRAEGLIHGTRTASVNSSRRPVPHASFSIA